METTLANILLLASIAMLAIQSGIASAQSSHPRKAVAIAQHSKF